LPEHLQTEIKIKIELEVAQSEQKNVTLPDFSVRKFISRSVYIAYFIPITLTSSYKKLNEP